MTAWTGNGEGPSMIHYNITKPTGMAIAHLLAASSLGVHVDGGIEIEEFLEGGRIATVHEGLRYHVSEGEAALLLVADSLASSCSVNLAWVLDSLDEWNQRVVVEALAMAAGISRLEVGAL